MRYVVELECADDGMLPVTRTVTVEAESSREAMIVGEESLDDEAGDGWRAVWVEPVND